MYGYNFTERTRMVLALARDAAVDLGHEAVGTEHLVLGLLAHGDGIAWAVLENLRADHAAIRDLVLRTVQRGRGHGSTGPDLPYTSRAKRALELAAAEAHELSHRYVGTEHLLLGLLREEHGVGAQVLVHSGVTLDRARTQVLRLLGNWPPLPQQEPA